MPALGVAQETGRVLKWFKSEGDRVSQGEMLLEVETDKATVELEAVASGVLRDITAVAGDEVPVGTVIAGIWADGETEAHPAEGPSAANGKSASSKMTEAETTANLSRPASQLPSASESDRSPRRARSSPKARRLAAERGIALDRISTGSTPVVAAAVLQSERGASIKESPATPGRIWRIMAERTTEAWTSVPHFYLNRQIDVSNLVAWREELRASLPEVTYTDLLIRKIAACLRLHPALTSEWRNGNIHSHAEINLGLAVAVDEGLLVPVIRNADRTTVAASEPLPKGKVQLKVDFAYQGSPKELGKGARVTLSANGKQLAQGQVPKTIPATISIGEGMDIGEDAGSPVDFTYKLPFKFTGRIEKVTFDLK